MMTTNREGTETQVQWGVRFGDGDIEELTTEIHARTYLKCIRGDIEAGHYEWSDYEPMAVVRRTRPMPEWSEWEDVPDEQS